MALDKAPVWSGSYSEELDLSMRPDGTAIPRNKSQFGYCIHIQKGKIGTLAGYFTSDLDVVITGLKYSLTFVDILAISRRQPDNDNYRTVYKSSFIMPIEGIVFYEAALQCRNGRYELF